ncbi:MAG: transposase, partial [Anaerolineae bacterium]
EMGPKTARKIIVYAHKVLLPEPELFTVRCELLAHDLALLDDVQQLITQLEDRLCALLEQTPYHVWGKLKGLSAVQVASLAASIGNPTHYEYAGQVFRRSGLVSGRKDSGTRKRKGKGRRITKTGDVYLRRSLIGAVSTLMLHQPVLYRYYTELKLSKPAGVARVATARRAIGILWAIQRDQRSESLCFKKGDQHVDQ